MVINFKYTCPNFRSWMIEVWLSEFPMLRFRQASQHATCSVCVRHRVMVKALGSHMRARTEQIRLFHEHLRAQYMDRCLYYQRKSWSRMKGSAVCVIADGMDQTKFSLPRSAVLQGKEFSTMQKVKLHIALAICHGRFILFSISNADCKKDPNASIELLSHGLTLLQRQGQDLPTTDLYLQHDNCCREFKNNSGLRWAASQVSGANLRSICCSYLRTGHTHEDVDQIFGTLSKFMLKQRKLQTPGDVQAMIEAFLKDAKLPFECERHCVVMNDVRDWSLAHTEVNSVLWGVGGRKCLCGAFGHRSFLDD